MKIGFFTDTYYPQINGVTISVDNFAKELRNRGHTVYIFAPKIKGHTDTDPFVIRLPSLKVISSEPEVMVPVFLSKKSLKVMYRFDFDIVHAHGNGIFSLLGYQVARTKGVPFVMTFHSVHTKYTHYVMNGKILRPGMVAALMRMFGNVCDGIITPSEKMKKELLRYGVKQPTIVIPNFIEAEIYRKKKQRFLHEFLSLHEDIPLLLSVGRLGKEKNFSFLIKMFKKLTKIDKKTHLVIVGQGTERLALQRLVKGLDLIDRVHFTGRIDARDMPYVYQDAVLFAFASTTETQGICVLEAAASGLPLVVAKDPAYDMILEHGKNGYALPLNQKVFAKTINTVLKDANLRKTYGEYSKKLAEMYFKKETCVDELLSFYAMILTSYNPKAKMLRRLNKATIVSVVRISSVINRFFTI